MATIEIFEAMAVIDASVAWNVTLRSEINAMAARGMNDEIARVVYLEHPEVILCGGGGPGTTPFRAERQSDGSVRVTAQTMFISGCHNANWCFLGAPLLAARAKAARCPRLREPSLGVAAALPGPRRDPPR